MRKSFARLFLLLAVVGVTLVPVSAAADTLSVTRVITITATVPPMRSIVINDKGQMTKIYSNTDQNVEPKVYVNKAPGPEKPLTPELKAQYDKIIAHTKNVVGVEIPVAIPATTKLPSTLQSVLGRTVSALTLPQILRL